jgi:hypothetical protein
MELADQAAIEQDGAKLVALEKEMAEILDEKQKRLDKLCAPKTKD